MLEILSTGNTMWEYIPNVYYANAKKLEPSQSL